jgi:IclR family transcriptional regulator, pca regulon regulatory protein
MDDAGRTADRSRGACKEGTFSMTTMSPIRGGILHLPNSQEGRYSQSLERGLAILTAFTPERTWMGIAELAETLEMSRPTTHRYASTLVALDYLEQGPGRKYRLGMRAGDPGRSAVSSTALGRLPQQYLAELRDRSMCTASLALLHGKDIVYVHRARSSWQGESEVAQRIGRGSRLPASRTAMGRVLLAYQSEQEQRAVIPDSADAPAERDKLVAELRSIRQKGIAIADQVRVEGQRCVAAAVMSRSSEVVAAVDVAASKANFSRAQLLEQLAPLVAECAERISANLGYTPSE